MNTFYIYIFEILIKKFLLYNKKKKLDFLNNINMIYLNKNCLKDIYSCISLILSQKDGIY